MNDPHFNIFHSYRGPSASEESSTRQLEDNLTRALVITLSTIQHSEARIEILRKLRIPEASLEGSYQCRLQVSKDDPDWPARSKRRLLVIHGGPKLDLTPENDARVSGRADATIAASDFVVAIESKLGNHVSVGQISRHQQTLNIPSEASSDITWTDLARAAQRARTRIGADPIVYFMLQQFEEYLRMNGFGGFTTEHFDYFVQAEENRDPLVKDGIRRSLTDLMASLASEWRSVWRPQRPGNIMRNSGVAWAKLEPRDEGQQPHLSVVIGPMGLDLFANIETLQPYRRFQTALKRDTPGLIAILRNLASDWPPDEHNASSWRFSVVHRIEKNPRHYDHVVAVDIVTAAFNDWPQDQISWFLESVTQTPENESAPQLKLIRTYPANIVIAENELPRRLAKDASQLEPFFEWIGEPVR